MSTSFRPQEAKEDTYVLGIVAPLLIGGAMYILASMMSHTGSKVVLLSLTGVEAQATIQSVRTVEEVSGGAIILLQPTAINSADQMITEVDIVFTDHDGHENGTSFLIQASQNGLQPDTPLMILYSRFDSSLALPVQSMSAHRIDAWIFSIAIGVMVLCALTIVFTIYRWRAFRVKARRY